MSIDLPAPVSPVSTLSPAANSTLALSMTAKFLTRSSRSIVGRARSADAEAQAVSVQLPLAPFELRAQDGEEVLLREANEADVCRGLTICTTSRSRSPTPTCPSTVSMIS